MVRPNDAPIVSRRAPRALFALATVALCAMCASSCDDGAAEPQDRVGITIFSSAEIGLPTTPTPIQQLRVTTVDTGSGQSVARTTIPVDSTHGVERAPDIPFGEGLQVHLEGIDIDGRVVSYGSTPRFALTADDEQSTPQFLVFMTEVGTVKPLSAVFSGRQVLPSPFLNTAAGGRGGHTATRLDDGRVLIVGGAAFTAAGAGIGGSNVNAFQPNVEVYNPRSGYFDNAQTPSGSPLTLSTPRVYHDTVKLADGRVIVIGGLTSTNGEVVTSTPVVEMITPRSDGTFELTTIAPLNTPRAHAPAVLRENGSVMVSGGENHTSGGGRVILDTVEILDVQNNVFVQLGPMNSPRTRHTATPLGNVVFIAGGENEDGALASSEVFSQNDGGSFVPQAPMTTARHSHEALRLSKDSGRYLLVAGGHTEAGTGNEPTFTFEIFDTIMGAWATDPATVGLQRGRASFDMIELGDGTIMVAGGRGIPQESMTLGALASVEVLIADPSSATLYEAFELPSTLQRGRLDTASTVLDSGMVIITGGIRFEGGGFASFERSDAYNPGPPPGLTAP